MRSAKKPQNGRAGFEARNIAEFLDKVRQITAWWFDEDDEWGPWFRGQRKASWPLWPKLYRDYGGFNNVAQHRIEHEMREEFILRAPVLSETKIAGGNDWEWYFVMQHFGAPTRLLDWTEGALLALYFAVKDNRGHHDAAVWVLDPYDLNESSIGKDEVIPPSAGVREDDAEKVRPWLPDRFDDKAQLPDGPLAVLPTHIARRISTQRSCFTVHGKDEAGLDKLLKGENGVLEKITIPSFRTEAIRKELEACGIDEVTIYPDLDGLSRLLSIRWLPRSKSLPHHGVLTRLRPSKVHKGGVGVFAITDIKEGTPLFVGDSDEMVWIDNASVRKIPEPVHELYDDFAVIKNERYGCPPTFNRLTLSWYLNEPAKGEKPNVKCDPSTYDFSALRDIKVGEELTVDYGSYSEYPSRAGNIGD